MNKKRHILWLKLKIFHLLPALTSILVFPFLLAFDDFPHKEQKATCRPISNPSKPQTVTIYSFSFHSPNMWSLAAPPTGSSAMTGHLVGSRGNDPGQFQYPLGLRSHRGALYIADAGNHRVQVLNSTLQHELSIEEDGDGCSFDRPNDVCIDTNGMIIVADTFRWVQLC